MTTYHFLPFTVIYLISWLLCIMLLNSIPFPLSPTFLSFSPTKNVITAKVWLELKVHDEDAQCWAHNPEAFAPVFNSSISHRWWLVPSGSMTDGPSRYVTCIIMLNLSPTRAPVVGTPVTTRSQKLQSLNKSRTSTLWSSKIFISFSAVMPTWTPILAFFLHTYHKRLIHNCHEHASSRIRLARIPIGIVKDGHHYKAVPRRTEFPTEVLLPFTLLIPCGLSS